MMHVFKVAFILFSSGNKKKATEIKNASPCLTHYYDVYNDYDDIYNDYDDVYNDIIDTSQ